MKRISRRSATLPARSSIVYCQRLLNASCAANNCCCTKARSAAARSSLSRALLRNYRIKDDGTESILRFAPENTWTTDRESLSKQIPSKNNIDALEESQVLLWNTDDLNNFLNTIPAFKAYTERIITNTLDATVERIHVSISYTSEEKYYDFVRSFPDLFNRVPLHMVASYLGVSRETLTRIRQGRVRE